MKSFKDHPFKVSDDADMHLLKESIEKYGILNPLIVRPLPEGVYEIISGHRRKYAAESLGHRKVPVLIRVMKDEESVIAMVDANLQRERISYSEKAFAYKMKNDAIKRVLLIDADPAPDIEAWLLHEAPGHAENHVGEHHHGHKI